jgi:hypothetical protein
MIAVILSVFPLICLWMQFWFVGGVGVHWYFFKFAALSKIYYLPSYVIIWLGILFMRHEYIYRFFSIYS